MYIVCIYVHTHSCFYIRTFYKFRLFSKMSSAFLKILRYISNVYVHQLLPGGQLITFIKQQVMGKMPLTMSEGVEPVESSWAPEGQQRAALCNHLLPLLCLVVASSLGDSLSSCRTDSGPACSLSFAFNWE